MWLKPLNVIVLFLLVFASLAQNETVASEFRNEQLDPRESNYLITLKDIAKEYAQTNPDTAMVLCQRALDLATEEGNDSIKGQIFIAFSTAHSYLADYQNSTRYAFDAIEIAEEYKDTVTMIDGLNNLGIDYLLAGEDAKAIDYFTRVESLSSTFGDSLRWGHALNNLGMMFGYQGAYDTELDYYDQAGMIFQHIGEKDGYANILLNSGTTYTSLEQFERANELYTQALEVFTAIHMTSGIQNTLQSMAENYLAANSLLAAEEKAQEALDLAEQFGFTQDIIYTLALLSEIAEAKGVYSDALAYYKRSVQLNQEIFTAEKAQQIAELETSYQTEKKEQELAIATLQVNQQRLQKYVWIVGFVVMILIGGIYFYTWRQRTLLQQKLLAEEVENLRFKINSLLGDRKALKLDRDVLNKHLHQPLSDREFEILQLTIGNKTNQEIAEEVFVSINTVKYHLKNIYEKLGVSNRKEALHLIVGSS